MVRTRSPLDPQGFTACVARKTGAKVTEIGGARTLDIRICGSGFGTVTSSPVGIARGTACLSRFVA